MALTLAEDNPSSALRAPSPLTEGRRLSRHVSIESLLPARGGEKVPKADEGALA
jgi:hypothetical protein